MDSKWPGFTGVISQRSIDSDNDELCIHLASQNSQEMQTIHLTQDIDEVIANEANGTWKAFLKVASSKKQYLIARDVVDLTSAKLKSFFSGDGNLDDEIEEELEIPARGNPCQLKKGVGSNIIVADEVFEVSDLDL